mmetsp:Transcript_44536/g.104529  ORF Transcript_44536/g.104529 Transcript_44536/m.104529 type:complete len:200 (-) Transcript_44536:751-1350(-)
MVDVRFVVVDVADAVAAVFAHHAEARRMRHLLDRMSHVPQRRAGPHLADAGAQRLVGRHHQPARQHIGLADDEHPAAVAEPAVRRRQRHVHVDDVALLELLVLAWDAVADHVVGRNAGRLRVAVVAHVGRRALQGVDDVVVAEPVQVFGRHPRHDMGLEHRQHLGDQVAGMAGLGHLFGAAYLDASLAHGRSPGTMAVS